MKFLKNLLKNKKFTIILSVILFCLLVYNVPVWVLNAEINKELALIKEKGDTYIVVNSELIPAEVPREDNAAPYYEAAIDIVNFKYNMISPSESEEYRVYINKDIKGFEGNLKSNEDVYELLKKGYQKPKCRFDQKYERGFEMDVLNYLKIRNIAQYMAAKTFYELENGETQKAVDDCTYMIRFIRNLSTGQFLCGETLINLMIGVAGQSYIQIPMKKMAENGEKADYSALLIEIDGLLKDRENALSRSLQLERTLSLAFFDKFSYYYSMGDILEPDKQERNPYFMPGASVFYNWTSEIFYLVETNLDSPSFFIKYRLIGQPFILADKLFYLRFMKNSIKSVEDGTVEEYYKNVDFKKMAKTYFIAEQLIPNVSKANWQIEKVTTDFIEIKAKLEKLNKK